jgi:hypothetical protein
VRGNVSADGRVGVSAWVSPPQGDVSEDGRVGGSAWVSPRKGTYRRMGVSVGRRGDHPPRRRVGGWAGRRGYHGRQRGFVRDYVVRRGHAGSPGSGGASPAGAPRRYADTFPLRRSFALLRRSARPLRQHADTFPLRRSFALYLRRSATPLRQHAGTPIRFPSGGGVRFSEDKELHEDKGDQSRWRNCEKLGD